MDGRSDLDKLQGSWSVTTLEIDGQPMPPHMLANAQITIEDNRFTSTGMGAVYEGTLELDSSTMPRQLSMKFSAGPEKDNTNLGIYEIEGDTWKLCLATRGTLRPSNFASTPGSGFALETLARGHATAKVKAKERKSKRAGPPTQTHAPTTDLEGEWSLVSAVMDGKPMEESAVRWVKRVTRANQTTVYAGPQVMIQVEFTHDSSKTPKTIDYLNTAGSNKGKRQYGIYELEGDVLKFLIAAPGAVRPSSFESAPDVRGTLTVWKRL